MFPVHPPAEIRGLPPVAYGNISPSLVEEFRHVLESASDEKPLQQFFERNPAMLLVGIVAPHRAWVFPRAILPKPEGGAWIPDFMTCDLTSTGPIWTIVELESPTAEPINSRGISAICHHAHQQIEDYRRHLANHAAFLRDGGWPISGERSPAWIVIGRRHEQQQALGAERLASLRQYSIEVASYDRLLSECEFTVKSNENNRLKLEELKAGVEEFKRVKRAMKTVDAIYLNKRGNPQDTSAWAYYRITSQGKDGDHIEVCLLRWPTFEDLDVVGDEQKSVVINPSDTGFASAYPNMCTLLQNKWNIRHSDEDLIGIRARDV
jgi:hypothetical protein